MRLNRQALTAPGGGGGSGKSQGDDSNLNLLRGISGIDFKGAYYPQCPVTTYTQLPGSLLMQAVWVPKDCTISKIWVPRRGSGVYTPSNYNGVGLYAYTPSDPPLLTLVGSTANMPTFWSSAPSWTDANLVTPYNATAGLYYVALLYNRSAQTTAPTLFQVNFGTGNQVYTYAASPSSYSAVAIIDSSGYTSLPSSVDFSFTTQLTIGVGCALS